jgi:hypothetical protein
VKKPTVKPTREQLEYWKKWGRAFPDERPPAPPTEGGTPLNPRTPSA